MDLMDDHEDSRNEEKSTTTTDEQPQEQQQSPASPSSSDDEEPELDEFESIVAAANKEAEAVRDEFLAAALSRRQRSSAVGGCAAPMGWLHALIDTAATRPWKPPTVIGLRSRATRLNRMRTLRTLQQQQTAAATDGTDDATPSLPDDDAAPDPDQSAMRRHAPKVRPTTADTRESERLKRACTAAVTDEYLCLRKRRRGAAGEGGGRRRDRTPRGTLTLLIQRVAPEFGIDPGVISERTVHNRIQEGRVSCPVANGKRTTKKKKKPKERKRKAVNDDLNQSNSVFI